MWEAVDFAFNEALYYETIVTEEGHTDVVVSGETSKRKYRIVFDGVPMSYRVTLESFDWCPFDGYENADMLDYRANKIFYTEDSEYLNWFFTVNEKQNAQIFEEARIYHFQILTEDTIIDVLSDAFPVIQPIDQTDAC